MKRGDARKRVIEGVVVDDRGSIERFCQAVVESTTEYDWTGGAHQLPDHLRDGLRAWAGEFIAWSRRSA